MNNDKYTDKAKSISSLQSSCANLLCLGTGRQLNLHLCSLVNSGFHLSPTQKTLMAFLVGKKGRSVNLSVYCHGDGSYIGENLPLQLKYPKNLSKYLWNKVNFTKIFIQVFIKTTFLSFCIWRLFFALYLEKFAKLWCKSLKQIRI